MTGHGALRSFTTAVVAAIVVAGWFSDAAAQKHESMPRVGILTPAPSAAARPSWDAFREAMKGLGYVEGKSVVYEYRSAKGQFDRLPQLGPSWSRFP